MSDGNTSVYAPWGVVGDQAFWTGRRTATLADRPVSPSAAADGVRSVSPPAPALNNTPPRATPHRVSEAELPEPLQSTLDALHTAVTAHTYDTALDLAGRLYASAMKLMGDQHPTTLWAGDINADVALRAGKPYVATRWNLHLASVRSREFGSRDHRTQETARRTAAAWRLIPNPGQKGELGDLVYQCVSVILGPRNSLTHTVATALGRTSSTAARPMRPSPSPIAKRGRKAGASL